TRVFPDEALKRHKAPRGEGSRSTERKVLPGANAGTGFSRTKDRQRHKIPRRNGFRGGLMEKEFASRRRGRSGVRSQSSPRSRAGARRRGQCRERAPIRPPRRKRAKVAELADAPDLGSGTSVWGFDSPLSHQ